MELEKLSRYAQGAYFSILLGHALDPDFVEHDIRTRYYEPIVRHIVNPFDYSVIVETHSQVIIAFAGTKTAIGWIENLACPWTFTGLHFGFDHFFRKCKADKIAEYIIDNKKPTVCYGYSQGGAVSGRCNLFLNETLKCKDVEGYSFCGPTWVNRRGLKRVRAAKMRHTEIYGDMDIVDDVGEIIGGKHYGYRCKLPSVGTNFIDGHYYHNFCIAMQILFSRWGLPREMKYMESIAGLCTI